MCIRDSSNYMAHAQQLLSHPAYITILTAGDEGKNGLSRFCLLYTSDAADERSSVDLGGRRIIKKKKIKRFVISSVTNNKKNTQRRSPYVQKKSE